jgi:hypothetical protein
MQIPGARERSSASTGFERDFEKAKHFLEENDGAGNTFKATAKPVLIGTAVVGATTMIFSIIVGLTHGAQPGIPVEPFDHSTRRSCSVSSRAGRSSTGSLGGRFRR